MSGNWDAVTTQRPIPTATIGFVAAFAVHAIDHFRRGMSASPPAVMVGGTIRGLIVVIALALILRGHPLGVPGRDRRRIRQRDPVRLRARAAHVSSRPPGQLHRGTANQCHLVLLAVRRR